MLLRVGVLVPKVKTGGKGETERNAYYDPSSVKRCLGLLLSDSRSLGDLLAGMTNYQIIEGKKPSGLNKSQDPKGSSRGAYNVLVSMEDLEPKGK